MMKLRRAAWLLVVAFLATAGFLVYQGYAFLSVPAQKPGGQQVVNIPPGTSFRSIAHILEREGIVTSAWKFVLLGKFNKKDGSLKAGEFLLHTGWTPSRILRELTSGQAILYRIGIPEGLTWWQTARVVADTGLTSYDRFSEAVRDKDILEKYSITGESAEGFLFPETYHVPRPRGGDPRPIVEAMIQGFWTQAVPLIWPEGPPSSEQLMETVILAALVEKETSVPEERPIVAGVYLNRLKRGMLLQADPTTIYGLGMEFEGRLRRKHLTDVSNPYNTYTRRGLPPGPICSPGLASLMAVVEPAEHDFLYFVSRNDGSHVFSRTLKEHNAAVYKYQIRGTRSAQ
jgi:UPF0755 protein